MHNADAQLDSQKKALKHYVKKQSCKVCFDVIERYSSVELIGSLPNKVLEADACGKPGRLLDVVHRGVIGGTKRGLQAKSTPNTKSFYDEDICNTP